MDRNPLADLVLRIGVAFSFLYPPIAALFDPYTWLGYLPKFLRFGGDTDLAVLHIFGIVEIVIALWILSGRRIFWPSIAATAILLLIVVLNLSNFEVLFRDVSIAAMTLALALMHRPVVRTA